MSDPTTDEVRLAWWMTPDNPADNEGASDLSFDRWITTVKADAWDEGFDAGYDRVLVENAAATPSINYRHNPYREVTA